MNTTNKHSIEDTEDVKYTPQTENLKSLAYMYNMDVRTLKKNIEPIMWKIKSLESGQRLIIPREVGYIIEHLGPVERLYTGGKEK